MLGYDLKEWKQWGKGSSPINLVPLGLPVLVAVAIPLPQWQPRNEGGGAAGSLIVLDELSAIPWEFWYLDLPDPQSAECGKWEVSTDLNMHKMSEKMQFLENCTFFFKHCIIVLTLRVFLLFVWFCPQMHVLGFFVVVVLYPYSSVHVFIAFLGVCSCLKKWKKKCERGFLNTFT